MAKGQCHCGAVRYDMSEDTEYRAVCHCSDCRRHSGSPMVAWGLVGRDAISIEGETKEYASSENGRRHFCPTCGTGLFYSNEAMFPGKIDVQLATLDDPDALPPEIQVQAAERLDWTRHLDRIEAFDRYPGP